MDGLLRVTLPMQVVCLARYSSYAGCLPHEDFYMEETDAGSLYEMQRDGWADRCAVVSHDWMYRGMFRGLHNESVLTASACAALPADCSMFPLPPFAAELSACCALATLPAAVTTDPREFSRA